MWKFKRYIGIDYSGAQTPTASLKGLRVYLAEGDAAPGAVLPPPSPRKYWTRRGIAEWLVERLAEDVATLVGIDRGFSLPRLDFQVQNPRNPFRRQPMTVSGLAITSASRQRGQRREGMTQNKRSSVWSHGRHCLP